MIKTRIEDSGYPQLIEKAREALNNAYCPYSGYKVGAAVLTDKGNIYTGCNVENGSYGASNCAERTAVFKAVSEGEKAFSAIAVFTEEGNAPPFPCGICRQVLSEFCSPDTQVIVYDGEKSVFNFTLEELLPFSFNFDK
ncbi:MAG: cytidine deaminase [Firmicutes bacterium]|nr:cytidine deaminase [[Eubacterium] siraeum]MCM1487663.1 cytidine deaminase [Bacillota bacterium]